MLKGEKDGHGRESKPFFSGSEDFYWRIGKENVWDWILAVVEERDWLSGYMEGEDEDWRVTKKKKKWVMNRL